MSFTGGIITGGNLQLTGGRKLLRAANNTGGINISELRLTGGIKQKKKYGWDRLRVGQPLKKTLFNLTNNFFTLR